MLLRLDPSDCLIASISFHDCFNVSVESGEDRSWEKLCLKFVEGLQLCMSPSEGHIFCQLDEGTCFSTVVNNKLIVIISKDQECVNILPLSGDGPFGHDFGF